MELHQMSVPLSNTLARCIGEICAKKSVCQRHLSIALDSSDPYKCFMDASFELKANDTNCNFFIEWGMQ
jgi:hypothetical protein